MSTDSQLIAALRDAAEMLIDRRLAKAETDDLVRYFNEETGTYQERAQKAIRRFTGLTETTIQKRAMASDNADRVIRDLEQILREWKPGT